jgi:septal ring factor EnvC (AmiA/AmiB activator)
MSKPKPIALFAAALLCCMAALAGPGRAADVSEVRSDLEQAIKKEIRAQKEADRWSERKQQLISEIRQAKTRLQWHRYQNEKYGAYIERERENIAELERRRREMKTLRMKLEPYLDEVIADLEAFVDRDMTFLSGERSDRIAYLQESMNNYHLSMSEKLRRVLEALQVEARYGRSTGVDTRTLRVEGQTLQVQVLRVGRIARFYRSLDGERVGRWNGAEGTWQPLPREYSRSVKQAIDMAQRKQAVDLVDLPIGGVEQ